AACLSPVIAVRSSASLPMTETYTVAFRRSPETSTRSTVTDRTRGSATSKRIAEEATSRIASAIRRLLCDGMGASYVHDSEAQDLGSGMDGDRVGDVFEDLQRIVPIAADRGDQEDSLIRVTRALGVGDGDVEVAMQLFHDRLHLPPEVARGVAVADPQ